MQEVGTFWPAYGTRAWRLSLGHILFIRRYPFAGITLFAIAGILFGDAITPCFWTLLIALGLTIVIGFLSKQTVVCYISVLLLFSAKQQWEKHLQPSIRYASVLADTVGEVEGYVSSEPNIQEANPNRCHFTITTTSWNHTPVTLNVLVHWKGNPPHLGDFIRVYSYTTSIPPPRNPGEFNYREWMLRQGIALELKANSAQHCEILKTKAGFFLRRLATQLRDAASVKITTDTLPNAEQKKNKEKWSEDRDCITPTIAALIHGVTFGGLQGFDDTWKERFRQTGTLHLFSVSGLHVGMVASLLWIVLSLLQRSLRFKSVTIIIGLLCYAFITGLNPACVRATTMAIIVFASFLSNRQPQLFNSLCLAAFVILLSNPQELFNPGFQLSFTIVIAIILLASPLHRFIANRVSPDSFLPKPLYRWQERFQASIAQRFAPMFSVTFIAWLASLFLIKTYYHLFSWIAMPLNILLIPIAFLILAIAFTSLATWFLWPAISIIFNNASFFLAWISLHLIQFSTTVPFSYTYANLGSSKSTTQVIVFDFVKSSAQLITTPHANFLIDTGSEFDTTHTLLPYLQSKGITHIDALLIAHSNSNYIGGASKLLSHVDVGQVLLYPLPTPSPTLNQLKKQLVSTKIPTYLATSNYHSQFSNDLNIDILYPPHSLYSAVTADHCVVVRASIADEHFLFLSDASLVAEDWLTANYSKTLDKNIIISTYDKNKTTPLPSLAFLRRINPKMIIASTGYSSEKEGRFFSHWKRQVEKLDIQVVNQNDTGAILFEFDDNHWKFKPYLQNLNANPEIPTYLP